MAAIPLAPEPCPGRRSKVWNRRWPICSTCDLQDDNGTDEPAAVMQGDQPFCPNRRFHVPTVGPDSRGEQSALFGGGDSTSKAVQALAAAKSEAHAG